MNKHVGSQSIKFHNPPSIISAAAVVGKKEGEGPLGKYFDRASDDMLFGKDSWELAESAMVLETIKLAIKKANLKETDINYVLAGDLLNQSTGSTFGVKDLNVPFFGLFGACSTMGEAMSLGAILIDGGFADYVVASASSHFCAAEIVFRYPLGLGTQRTLTSSHTVTGDGAVVMCANGSVAPYVTAITTGKIVDMGLTDANNMGAAMAPAAVDTLVAHFKDFNRTPDYYDLILTGDLGHVGHELVVRLMKDEGYNMTKNYTDCGIEIYDQKKQDTHAGGSGCGCSAVTFAGYLYQMMQQGTYNKILFMPTGALMNQTTALQGQTIPAIVHGVVIENTKG